jgi:hypothetical protein
MVVVVVVDVEHGAVGGENGTYDFILDGYIHLRSGSLPWICHLFSQSLVQPLKCPFVVAALLRRLFDRASISAPAPLPPV